jgi:hypothetical protein
MSKKNRLIKELKKREVKALTLYGSEKYHLIYKNHKRLMWLKKKLKIKNEPRRMSVASILLSRMMK